MKRFNGFSCFYYHLFFQTRIIQYPSDAFRNGFTIFIINNKILGNTKSYQRVNKKAELACGPDGYSVPDFCKIANAYGIYYWSYELHGGGYELIDMALERDGPCIFDAIHEDFCQYEPRMSRWDAAINEMHPPLPEAEFLANCINPPLEGWEKRR